MSVLFNIFPHKIFIVNENIIEIDNTKKVISNFKEKVDAFTNYKNFLFLLNFYVSKRKHPYNIGFIYQNGNKVSSELLCKFIHDIDPNIKTVVYKNEDELKYFANNMSLV